ncbi:polysaccharide pyruvyl transferase family protein [Xanthomonas perforans]
MITVYHWNPRRSVLPGRFARYGRVGPRLSNFGDLLGPIVVNAARRATGAIGGDAGADRTLFSIGSVLHEASDGDVVWGAGINGKKRETQHSFSRLDVRAVRGMHTARKLEQLGIDVPPVFGDPALLLPILRPEMTAWTERKTRSLAVVPNFNEIAAFRGHPGFVSPLGDPDKIIRAIAESEAVVGSSLHAIVIAEALGVPAVAIESAVEPSFKYQDYYSGTGRARSDYIMATDLEEAVRSLPSSDGLGPWDSSALLEAFPKDLWRSATAPHTRGL